MLNVVENWKSLFLSNNQGQVTLERLVLDNN